LLRDGSIEPLAFLPAHVGVTVHSPELLSPEKDRETAAKNMYKLLAGRGGEARNDAVALNSGLIFYLQKSVPTIKEGVEKARDLLLSGKAFSTLEKWVAAQNRDADAGLARLEALRHG
jgi:anthranilate phosphoribosyltransferase